MDFVVVGLGIGAVAVLLGLALRDLGPFVRRVPREGWMPWTEVAARVAWGGRCRATGLVVALAGAGLCLVTGIGLLAQVSDDVGMWLVLIASAVAILAVVGWAVRMQLVQSARRMTLASPVETTVWSPRTEVASESAARPARRSALAGIRLKAPNLRRTNEYPRMDGGPAAFADSEYIGSHGEDAMAEPDPDRRLETAPMPTAQSRGRAASPRGRAPLGRDRE